MKLTFSILLFAFLTSCHIKKVVRSSENKNKLYDIENSSIAHDSFKLKENEGIEPESWDTTYLGDINNDKIPDTAFIYTPPLIQFLDSNKQVRFHLDCVNSNCYNLIKFSNALPDINYNNSIWGAVDTIGDLNNDGYSELIFSPCWFTSCWGRLYIYSFDGEKWNKTTEISYNRCGEETLNSHVEKIKNKYFLNGSKFIDGDIEEYKVEIKIPK